MLDLSRSCVIEHSHTRLPNGGTASIHAEDDGWVVMLHSSDGVLVCAWPPDTQDYAALLVEALQLAESPNGLRRTVSDAHAWLTSWDQNEVATR